jgi:hypothetical protein
MALNNITNLNKLLRVSFELLSGLDLLLQHLQSPRDTAGLLRFAGLIPVRK